MRRYFIGFIILTCFFCLSCTNGKNNKNDNNFGDSDSVTIDIDKTKKDTLLTTTDSSLMSVDDSVRISTLKEASKVSSHAEITRTESNKKYYADNKGIGIITLGDKISKLPGKCEGLYDQKKLISDGAGGRICLIYSKNEQIIEIDFDNKTDVIKSIRITNPSLKTVDGISLFMDYNTILKNNTIKQHISNNNTDDCFKFELNGIKYEISENNRGDKFVSAIIIEK